MIGKLRLLFWMGIVMLFLPFFGIPNTWKTILAILIGLVLILVSLSLRKRYRAMRNIIRNLEHSVAQHTMQSESQLEPLSASVPEEPSHE
jgi:uncharacterized membrane protein